MPEKNYVFCYPAQKIGGAQLLFARLASQLCQDHKKVTVVGNTSGFISQYLDNERLVYSLVQLESGKKYHTLPEDVLILSASFINITRKIFEINNDSILFFWELHPFALIEQLGFSKIYKNSNLAWLSKLILRTIEYKNRKIMESFLSKATECNGFVFMCGKNYEYNRLFFKISQPKFLPIPVMMKREPTPHIKTRNKASDVVRISWLGRIDTKKLPLVELILRDLQSCENISLSIIGSGDSVATLETISKAYDFEVDFVGTVASDELSKYIIRNVDVGIAIGTSSLEFAKLGIPTIIMPGVNEFQKNETKKYNWLYNSRDFDLCTTVKRSKSCQNISELIQEYREKGSVLGHSCLDYVESNHSFESIYTRFLEQIEKGSFTHRDAKVVGLFDINNSIVSKTKRFLKNI